MGILNPLQNTTFDLFRLNATRAAVEANQDTSARKKNTKGKKETTARHPRRRHQDDPFSAGGAKPTRGDRQPRPGVPNYLTDSLLTRWRHFEHTAIL